jgi:transcriptional regulator with GAF, ATPase, and Fis domain
MPVYGVAMSVKKPAPPDLLDAFAELARTLLAQEDVAHKLRKVVELAVQTIEGCDHAAITLIRGRGLSTEVASDEVGPLVDAIQYETDEGPCLDAIREHRTVVADNLAEEDRWPNFAKRTAEETGVVAMLAFRLFVDEDTMGALNLYSRQVGAFTASEASQHVGVVFAAHAAVAWSSARHQEQLQEALRTRELIGQAMGILMASSHLSKDRAFEQLKRVSQALNIKLRDVADYVTMTGALPDRP